MSRSDEISDGSNSFAESVEDEYLPQQDNHSFTISDELERMKIYFGTRIVEQASALFKKLGISSIREKKKKGIALYCLYKVLEQYEDSWDRYVLAVMLNIPKKIADQCVAYGTKCNKDDKVVIKTPYHFILCYLSLIGLDSTHKKNVVDLLSGALEKEPKFREYFPQNVAAGIVFYYANHILKMDIRKNDYANWICKSVMTLGKINILIERTLESRN
jgi:hypothetical protein